MLIANIADNHMGSIHVAKMLIKAAHDSGADLIKSRAYVSDDGYKYGFMPRDYYEQCQMTSDEYSELIQYARSIGTDLFYSIYSRQLIHLIEEQQWMKISACQVKDKDFDFNLFKKFDSDVTFIDVPQGMDKIPFKKAYILYSTEYMPKDPALRCIADLQEIYNQEVGYSDHCAGIDTCLKAAEQYGVNVIEKHFCLKRDLLYKGMAHRDMLISAEPFEMELLAFGLEKIHSVTRH